MLQEMEWDRLSGAEPRWLESIDNDPAATTERCGFVIRLCIGIHNSAVFLMSPERVKFC